MPRLRLLHCGLLLAGCSSALLGAGTFGSAAPVAGSAAGKVAGAAADYARQLVEHLAKFSPETRQALIETFAKENLSVKDALARLQQLEQSGKPLSESGPETARLNKVAENISENQKDKASPGLSVTIEKSFIARVQTWDLNHDGKVTCEEWRTYAASLFREADSDHDGKLTREEFAKLPKIDWLFEVANFDYYDVNKWGYVTQAYFVGRTNPAFEALDHDKSCVINLWQAATSEEASGGGGCLTCTSGRGQGEEEGSDSDDDSDDGSDDDGDSDGVSVSVDIDVGGGGTTARRAATAAAARAARGQRAATGAAGGAAARAATGGRRWQRRQAATAAAGAATAARAAATAATAARPGRQRR